MEKIIFIPGLILYASVFAYHIFISTLGVFGPLDILVSATGLLLMIPQILSICRTHWIRNMYLLVGAALILASVHDVVGLHLSRSTTLRFLDATIWLTGVVFILPYLAALGGPCNITIDATCGTKKKT